MAPAPRALLAGAAACAVAFVILLAFAYGSSEARWLDASALQGFLGLQRPRVTPVTQWLAALGNPLQVGLIGGGMALFACARGRPRVALFVIALVGVTSVSSQALKSLLSYPRYGGDAVGRILGPDAFPSGHATASMSLAIALVVVMPRRLRPAAALVGTGLALAVSFSVVSMAWHFPSDVVGGFLLATGWALVLLAGLRAAEARFPERTGRSRIASGVSRALEGAAAVGLAGVIGAAAVLTVVVVGAVLLRPGDLVGYLQDHTVFFAVAGALALSAVALLTVLATVLTRRG